MAETTPDIQGLAEIMSFGPEWIVFRQFRILQIRLMLELQAKIERLAIADPEGELEKTVDKYSKNYPLNLYIALAPFRALICKSRFKAGGHDATSHRSKAR